jgi:hypothetical protein
MPQISKSVSMQTNKNKTKTEIVFLIMPQMSASVSKKNNQESARWLFYIGNREVHAKCCRVLFMKA